MKSGAIDRARRYTVIFSTACMISAIISLSFFISMLRYRNIIEEKYEYLQRYSLEKGFYISKMLIELEELSHLNAETTPDYDSEAYRKINTALSFSRLYRPKPDNQILDVFRSIDEVYAEKWDVTQQEFAQSFEALYTAVIVELEKEDGDVGSILENANGPYGKFLEKAKTHNDALLQISLTQMGHLSSTIDRQYVIIMSAVAFSATTFLFILIIFLVLNALRKTTMSSIENSEKMYRTTFQSMMNGFALHEIILDDLGKPVDYRFLEINEAFERLTGLKGEDLRGRRVKEVLPGTEDIWIERYGNVAMTGIHDHFTSSSEDLGKIFEVECYSPEMGKFVTIFDDVTARINLISELRNAKVEAEKAYEAKQAFLANMSHELRTPLNGIKGMTSLLMSSGTNPHQTQLLQMLHESTNAMVDIVNSILDYNRIDSGQFQVQLEPFSLRETLGAIADNFSDLLREKNLTFEFTLEGERDWVVSDRVVLGQVVTNLLLNAYKFTDDGFVRLHARTGEVLTISVEDTGPGINEDDLGRIYDVFYQAENPYTKAHRGLGVGLAIVKSLLDKIEGSIAYSRPDIGGSRFTIEIPIDTPSEDHMYPRAPSTSDFTGGELSVPRKPVLIVEDDAISCMYMTRLLKEYGLDVDVAENAEIAIKRWKNHDYAFIIMDIGLPTIDGIELTKIIRQDASYEELPIFAVTSHNQEWETQRMRDAGINAVILKPANSQTIQAELSRWF